MVNFFQMRKKCILEQKKVIPLYNLVLIFPTINWFNVKYSVIVSYFEKWTLAKVSSRSGMLAFDGE